MLEPGKQSNEQKYFLFFYKLELSAGEFQKSEQSSKISTSSAWKCRTKGFACAQDLIFPAGRTKITSDQTVWLTRIPRHISIRQCCFIWLFGRWLCLGTHLLICPSYPSIPLSSRFCLDQCEALVVIALARVVDSHHSDVRTMRAHVY